MKLDCESHILVTGGASGLGAACVEMLVSKFSCNITIMDRDVEEAEIVKRKLIDKYLHETRFNIDIIEYDATDENSIVEAMKNVKRPLHGLINSAGAGFAEPTIRFNKEENSFLPHSMDTFKMQQDINLIGLFSVVSKAAAIMCNKSNSKYNNKYNCKELIEQDNDRCIINVSSVAGYEGQQGQTAYSASKAAIIGLTLPMARDLSSYDIRVNAIAPGFIKTPMTESFQNSKVGTKILNQTCAPSRFGKPIEFAHVCVFLLENLYMNAEVVRMDGGVRMPKL